MKIKLSNCDISVIIVDDNFFLFISHYNINMTIKLSLLILIFVTNLLSTFENVQNEPNQQQQHAVGF